MHYLKFLAEAHRQIRPELYLEIGIRIGRSLAVSRTKSYGIDPAFAIKEELNAPIRLFRMTSDAFFGRADIPELFHEPADMAFIDGMHHFEYVLRDFMNVEKVASRRGMVFLDDVFPRKPEWATREKPGGAWTGDVWKILPCLQKHREDLVMIPVDTYPTGLLLVCNLDSSSRTLKARYDDILEEFNSEAYASVPQDVLERQGAVESGPLVQSHFMSIAASLPEDADIRLIFANLKLGQEKPAVALGRQAAAR